MPMVQITSTKLQGPPLATQSVAAAVKVYVFRATVFVDDLALLLHRRND